MFCRAEFYAVSATERVCIPFYLAKMERKIIRFFELNLKIKKQTDKTKEANLVQIVNNHKH